MSRFFVLLLPLLALWWALGSGADVGEASASSAKDGIPGWGTSPLKEGGWNESKKPGLDRLKRLLTSQGQEFDWKGRSGDTELGPIPEDLVGTQELVDLVWAKIDLNLRKELSDEEGEELRKMIARLTGPEAGDQPWVCWAPGVSLAKVAAFHQVEQLTGMVRSGATLFANQFLGPGRWNRTASDGFLSRSQGRPTTLTWSIVPDGTEAPDLEDDSVLPSDLRTWLTSIYGGNAFGDPVAQPWFPILEAAFSDLEETCGVEFVYEPSDDGASLSTGPDGELGVRGDIRLGSRAIDGFSGTLAYAFAPGRGDLVFDSSDATFQSTSNSSLRFHNTLTHELGHALGLDHVCPVNETKLMEPILSLDYRGPRFDEFQSLQRQYGDVLEDQGEDRNNDSADQATPLSSTAGESLGIPRLSIDDNDDVDYFELAMLEGERISVSVIPGEGSYLEGGQIGEACSGGSLFDSGAIHDLRLELREEDGLTVAASSLSGGLGENEQIIDFEIPADGTYFIRVNGDGSNAAQLYRMDVAVEERPPAPRLALLDTVIIAESGDVKNGWMDPGETVKARFVLKNVGELPTSDLVVQVNSGDGVTVFSSEFGSSRLEPGLSSYLDVVMGATGECGQLVDVDFEVAFGEGLTLGIAPELTLGDVERSVPIDVTFEGSTLIPTGWSGSVTGEAVSWRISSIRSDSPFRSIYAPAVDDVGESILIAPSFVLSNSGGNLTFRHSMLQEGGYDGGVLEASRDGGPWFDLLLSEADVLEGGYNDVIDSRFGSPIGGRQAWSGSWSGFITTSIYFPESWAGETIHLRWRSAHDSSTSLTGWFLDDIRVETTRLECARHRPVLTLQTDGDVLDESDPSMQVNLRVSPELPLLYPVSFEILATGSADGDDYTGALAGVLEAGSEVVELPLSVIVDQNVEGDESLQLNLFSESDFFVPGVGSSRTVTIVDGGTIQTWMVENFGGAVPLNGDSDGDGASELEEYLLGTDPRSRLSVRRVGVERREEGLLIPLSGLPQRQDASIEVESSTDLRVWNTAESSRTDDGIVVDDQGSGAFLRLIYSLNN
ncbi:MAG: matrixin family metalloprotease [Akkermansiaceae bacterium]